MKKSITTTALTFMLLFCFKNNSFSQEKTQHNNKEVRDLIKKKRAFNKKNEFGYRIQLYYGTEKKAKSHLNEFKNIFPGISTKLTYSQPNWKVKVGNYRDKLSADRALNLIREKFSSAIIIQK